MEFKNTSEYVYLSTLSRLFDSMLCIVDKLSDEQLKELEYANYILNMEINDFNTDVKTIN